MSSGPISLRLVDGAGHDRHVDHTGLSWRKGSHGGWLSAEATVRVDHGDFTDLGPNDRMFCYDKATGRCLWEGYLDNPGVTSGPGGQSLEITASGPATLAQDATYPVAYVDRDLSGWEPGSSSRRRASVSMDPNIVTDEDALHVRAQADASLASTWQGTWRYRRFNQAGLLLGRVSATVLAGVTDSNFRQLILTRVGVGATTTVSNQAASTTAGTVAVVAGADIPTGHDGAIFRATRTGSTVTGDDEDWFAWYNVAVRALLKNPDGTNITAGYTTDTVLASQVVADMIGRGMLPLVDISRVSIIPSWQEWPIDQLAAFDGISAASMLDALELPQPGTRWGYFESRNGLHRFEYRPWDDSLGLAVAPVVTYELDDTEDAVQITGSDNDLCNRIKVSWTTFRGKQRSKIVTATVPALGARVRDADPVSIPDGFGSEAVATQVGQSVLASKSTPPVAGTATVRRPIRNLVTGTVEMPWEMEPGVIVRLRSSGVAVRLTELEYVNESQAAGLTLGSPRLGTDELLARLTRRSPIERHTNPGVIQAAYHSKGHKGS